MESEKIFTTFIYKNLKDSNNFDATINLGTDDKITLHKISVKKIEFMVDKNNNANNDTYIIKSTLIGDKILGYFKENTKTFDNDTIYELNNFVDNTIYNFCIYDENDNLVNISGKFLIVLEFK